MIERDLRDGILTLRLAHGKASALDVELLRALIEAVGEAERADEVRAVVLTGKGSIFSAGVDLFRLVDGGAEYVEGFFGALVTFIRGLFAFPKPLVVAANGHAIAGGGVMVAAGDYRLMADGNGRIGVPELVVGVPFPAAALEAVRFAVPRQHVQALVYTGRTLLPGDALAWGLVNEVRDADVLERRAREVAAQMAALPRAAFALAKRHLRSEALERMDRLAASHDAEAFALWSAPETHAAIRDYLARTVRR